MKPNFIHLDYFIASTTTVLLLLGLVFARIEPFYESIFFLVVGSFLLIFLMFLIRDMDNPFGNYENSSSEDVSLNPLEAALSDLQARVAAERLRVSGDLTQDSEPQPG